MLLNRWFLMHNNEVVNVIVYDAGNDWTPPTGHELTQAIDGVGIGWRFVDGQWVAPEEPPVE